MRPQYFAVVARRQTDALREFEHVDAEASAEVLRMGTLTMERILRRHLRGANCTAASVPCVPDESQAPSKPAAAQIDTSALFDGDMIDGFF